MKTKLLILAAAVATALLSGCVVVPDHGHDRGYYDHHDYHRDAGRRGDENRY